MKPIAAIVFLFSLAAVLVIGGQVAADENQPPGTEVAGPAPTAPAATTPPAAPAPSLDRAVTALRTGNWRLLAAVVLSVSMAGLGRLRARVAWLRGDRGGAILVAVLALLGSLAMSLDAGAPVDAKLFLSALAVTWTAVGGYTWVKRLIWPADRGTVLASMPGTDPDRFVRTIGGV